MLFYGSLTICHGRQAMIRNSFFHYCRSQEQHKQSHLTLAPLVSGSLLHVEFGQTTVSGPYQILAGKRDAHALSLQRTA